MTADSDDDRSVQISCPLPVTQYANVLVAHGGGGRLMHDLLRKVFLPAFANDLLGQGHDATVFGVADATRLAFTTDSYVVRPLFFPGGDIGRLAVYGTVNDLAMAGARPLYLSAGFILEEGLAIESLWRIVQSMASAAALCGVQIVTGDTKVVDRGKGDGVFINTSGVGVVEHQLQIGPRSVREGDVVITNGDIGRHGIAILAVREGLEFETTIESDLMPLARQVLALLEAGIEVHCLRDMTRGGMASALNEIAESARVAVTVEERLIPCRDDVRAACEILGFDPLHVANEGRFLAFVPAAQADLALSVLARQMSDSVPAIVGRVTGSGEAGVVLKTILGPNRVLDMLSGEQLPRIC